MSDLSSYLGKKELCGVFCESLEVICQYTYQDISNALGKADMEVLGAIHRVLADKAAATFPAFKDHRVINRQVKHKILPDIYHLGYSIVNNLQTKDLEKVFTQTAKEPTDQGEACDDQTYLESQFASLLSMINSLSDGVSLLESELKQSREDKKELLALIHAAPSAGSSAAPCASYADVLKNGKPRPDSDSDESDGFTFQRL